MIFHNVSSGLVGFTHIFKPGYKELPECLFLVKAGCFSVPVYLLFTILA